MADLTAGQVNCIPYVSVMGSWKKLQPAAPFGKSADHFKQGSCPDIN